MACGTPVIAWRCGSVPEVVEHGISGFIVDGMDEAVAAVRPAGPARPAPGPGQLRPPVLGRGDGAQLSAALLAPLPRQPERPASARPRSNSPDDAGRGAATGDPRTPARLFALEAGRHLRGGRRLRRHHRRRRRPVPRRHAPAVALPAEHRRAAAGAAGRRGERGQCRLHRQPHQSAAAADRRPVDPAGRDPCRADPADLGGSPLRAAAAAQFRPGRGAAAAAPRVRRRLSRHVRGPRPDARHARARPGGRDRRRLGGAELRGAGRPRARLDPDLRPAARPTSPRASPTSR